MAYRRGVLACVGALWCAGLLCGLSGCWLAGAYERTQGKSVEAVYRGIDNKSVAIVVSTPQAIDFEYPQAQGSVGVRGEILPSGHGDGAAARLPGGVAVAG